MQISSLFVIAAIAVAATNAASLGATQRDVMSAPVAAMDRPLFSRAVLDSRAAASSINSQATAAQASASSGLAQARAAMSKLNANTVTAEQLKPVIAQITSAITPASHTFTALAAQAKNANAHSKRQGPDLNKAVDTLVIDLNKTLVTLTPLVKHREY
jgi:hypothetical protein